MTTDQEKLPELPVHPPSVAGRWILAAGIVALFLIFDFMLWAAIRPHPQDWFTLSLTMAAFFAQTNLIAIWAAMGPGNFVVRVPGAVLLAALAWAAFVAGIRQSDSGGPVDAPAVFGAAFVVGVFVALIPLLVLRGVFRWRLMGWDNPRHGLGDGPLQFQIWHLLVATLLVALTLSVTKLVAPTMHVTTFPLTVADILVLLMYLAITCYCVTLPCTGWVCARVENLAGLAFAGAIYCLFVSGLEFGILSLLLGSPPDSEPFLMLFVINLAQATVVCGTLLIFRAAGLRLQRSKRLPPL